MTGVVDVEALAQVITEFAIAEWFPESMDREEAECVGVDLRDKILASGVVESKAQVLADALEDWKARAEAAEADRDQWHAEALAEGGARFAAEKALANAKADALEAAADHMEELCQVMREQRVRVKEQGGSDWPGSYLYDREHHRDWLRARAAEYRDSKPAVPPMRPDPNIIGNIEGNKKVLASDKAAAQRELDAATAWACATPDCPGDSRYVPPGRGHTRECLTAYLDSLAPVGKPETCQHSRAYEPSPHVVDGRKWCPDCNHVVSS